jgi:hypothetical protein
VAQPIGLRLFTLRLFGQQPEALATDKGAMSGPERLRLKPIEEPVSRRDSRVSASPTRVSFPATKIGRSSTARVTVTNDDHHPAVVEGLVPTANDPFRDFTVLAPRSIPLAPNAQTEIAVKFEPSRAAPQSQTFQLLADGAPVPALDVTVEGQGLEFVGETIEDRIKETNGRATENEALNEHDALRAQRVQATTAIRTWEREAEQRNQLAADWSRDNWTEFVGRTGGDFTLYPTNRLLGVVKHGVTDWIEFTFEPENLALRIVAKHAVEEIVDFFVDHLAGVEEQPSAAEQVATATNQVARTAVAKSREINVYRDRANAVVADAASAANLRVQEAQTGKQLDEWNAWASAQLKAVPSKKNVDDRSLRDELLKEWVLQRAATPTSANMHTNPEAWKVARERLEESGQLESLKRPDLFIHQCRYEWNLLGLEADHVVAELEARRAHMYNQARSWGNSPAAAARIVAAYLSAQDQEQNVFTKSKSPRHTADVFKEQFVGYDEAMASPDELHDRFQLICLLQLGTDGEGIFVKRFHYKMGWHDVMRSPR